MIGSVLKNLRKNANKTQLEIANILSISQQTYAKYESDMVQPSLETLDLLANYFNVSVDYLLNRATTLDDEFIVMARDIQSLDQNDANTIKDLINYMRSKRDHDN